MTWNSATVPAEDLLWMLGTIRSLGGTVIGSRPQRDGVCVTWTIATADRDDTDRSSR